MKYRISILAALLNLASTVVLAYSFQASSTDFMLRTDNKGGAALCVGKTALFSSPHPGTVEVAPGSGCPDWPNSTPTAVVKTDHPLFIKVGLLLLLLGFLAQVFSIERPHPTFSDAEIRELRKLRKLLPKNESSN